MALNTQFLPRAQSAIVNKDGTATIEFRNFLLRFLTESAEAGTITEQEFLVLQQRVKDLEDKALSNVLTGLYSVAVSGSTIYLINDVANPQGSQYYGTDVDGVRGWYNIIDGFQTGVGIVKSINDDGYNVLGTIENTNQLPPTGNVGDAYILNGKYIVWDGSAWVTAGSPSNTAVLSLAMVADSGSGTLLAIIRDAYGRVTGTRSATITGTTGRIVVTNGDASSGLPTIDLSTIANSGAGSLLAITIDTYGRVTGTRPATITGTTQQIDVANGTAAAGLPTLSLAAEVLASLDLADNAVQEVRPGTNVTVDNTDPRRPVVSAIAPPDGYIDGFKLAYSGASQISVSSGNAYVPSVGAVVSGPSSTPSVSVGANTFGHVYLLADGTTEVDSTAPSAAYSGTARTKTGDSSRRYLGSVLTDSLGGVYMFMHVGTQITYMVSLEDAPFRVLANGQQTTPTSVSVASIVPPTSSIATFGITNIDAAVAALIKSSSFSYTSNPNSFAAIPVPLDASNSFNYNYIVTPIGGLYMDCLGYYFER